MLFPDGKQTNVAPGTGLCGYGQWQAHGVAQSTVVPGRPLCHSWVLTRRGPWLLRLERSQTAEKETPVPLLRVLRPGWLGVHPDWLLPLGVQGEEKGQSW